MPDTVIASPRQKVLVLGGHGFIGLHAVRYLAARGHEVHATHRPGVRPQPLPGITWLPCDLAAPGAAARYSAPYESVIYLAQARSWRSFPGGVPEVMRINVDAALEAITHAAAAGVRRFLFASTGSVYACTDRVAREDDAIDLDASRNFYAASKLAGETLLRPFAQMMSVVLLRLYMPYGPGQSPDYLFPKLVYSVRDGQPITLSGPDGFQSNPVAVDDVARVLDSCLGLEQSATLNVAGPEIVSLRTLGETIGAVIGRSPIFETRAAQPTQIIAGDTTRLCQTLGWAPATALRAGLESYLGVGSRRRCA